MNTATDQLLPTQRIVKIRRDYNTWVANETLEDYALRFTSRKFRKWSELNVANTAFGAASLLVLEAIGASIMLTYGFVNAFWAFLAIGLIIFLTSLPISYYAARYGVDMDLLTRGAGFGYIGSTITSLIYASFTFVLFAFEGSILAYALELGMGIPPSIGYLLSALVVIPLVTNGITLISRFQAWTQPVWLILLVLPFVFLFSSHPEAISGLWHFAGKVNGADGFNWLLFGSAVTVGLALIPQIGEQVDYLRFMPEKNAGNKLKWHAGVLIGGVGWIFLGMLKLLGGTVLAYLAIRGGVSLGKVLDPNQMYLYGFNQVFGNPALAAGVTTLFVVLSQLKINITNAYAGSLAWSNFFSRLTHSHPGRVVWVVFNVLIALMLMEMNVFNALEQVLGLYANVAISWIVAVVADLVVNKPLGLSPKGIEFRRAYLYDINPVGVGATLIASALSIAAFTGVLGANLQSFSSFVAMVTAFVFSPLIAWWTGGKYYLARKDFAAGEQAADEQAATSQCCVCGKSYEREDIAHCPAYQGNICSLCCTLDARCHDLCRPHTRMSAQWVALLRKLIHRRFWHYLDRGWSSFFLLFPLMAGFLVILFALLYYHESLYFEPQDEILLAHFRAAIFKIFVVFVLISGIASWWLVLLGESRRVAQKETSLQSRLLLREISAHRETDAKLQKARQVAESANQAKSRYVYAISHELRTPLNSILGYSQILDGDKSIPLHRRRAISVIRKSGEHLLSLIEGVLDIARIESGKLKIEMSEMQFPEFLQQLQRMFELQVRNKGIEFVYEELVELPQVVRADKKRLGQILINILGNAVKYTEQGRVHFRVSYAREMALFEIEDSGPGMSEDELKQVFEPFVRGSAAARTNGGTGLGLTISKMLVDLMGGELHATSTLDAGSKFQVRLFLPHVHHPAELLEQPRLQRTGYLGVRRRILVVDNEAIDRELLLNVLEPLGFVVGQAASGYACLDMYAAFKPDLILMDLGMPGIDGWETIRRIRQGDSIQPKIAVVSANAFDKGLGNDCGVQAEDFILKPLNVAELIEMTGRTLALEWLSREAPPPVEQPPVDVPGPLTYPPDALLAELQRLVEIGYVSGIASKLDEIVMLEKKYAGFVGEMRELLRQYEFKAINRLLRREPVT